MARTSFSNHPLAPGTRLPRYTIERKLSSGGFGAVYLARREDSQAVAIKEFLPSVLDCRTRKGTSHVEVPAGDIRRFRDGLEAFFREADTLAKLHDPRVIPVWDVFEANGTAYFAMPLEKGCTLQAAIRHRASPFSDSELQALFLEASLGVEALHDRGLLHLDLKPSNLWVRPEGTVVVLDLGASRWQDEEGRASQMARTPGFAAPEQHGMGKGAALGPCTDIYGLSATLYAALEGSPPSPAPKRMPGELGLSVRRLGQREQQLLTLVDQGMALDPLHRWPSIQAWRQALARISRLSMRSPMLSGRPGAAHPLASMASSR